MYPYNNTPVFGVRGIPLQRGIYEETGFSTNNLPRRMNEWKNFEIVRQSAETGSAINQAEGHGEFGANTFSRKVIQTESQQIKIHGAMKSKLLN